MFSSSKPSKIWYFVFQTFFFVKVNETLCNSNLTEGTVFLSLSGIKDGYFCSKHHKILESKSSYLACPLEDKTVVWQFVLGDL